MGQARRRPDDAIHRCASPPRLHSATPRDGITAHVVNREPSPSPAPPHAQLAPCSLLAQSPPASDVTRLIMANLACEVFLTPAVPSPLSRAAFGLSLFTRWRTRGKGRIPMIRLAIGRSDSRMGETSNQSEGRVSSSWIVVSSWCNCSWTMPMHGCISRVTFDCISRVTFLVSLCPPVRVFYPAGAKRRVGVQRAALQAADRMPQRTRTLDRVTDPRQVALRRACLALDRVRAAAHGGGGIGSL